MAEIITVLSGKGGTGKTLFASNLGAYISSKGKRALIIDLNFQARGIDMALGIESRVIYDLVDVLRGDCRIKQALTASRHHKGLYVLEPPLIKKGGSITALEFEILLKRVKDDFDYVIIDTASSSLEIMGRLGEISDRILMVTSQDPVCVRAGQTLMEELKQRNAAGKVSLIINEVRLDMTDKGYLTAVEDIAEYYGTEVCGVLPYDENMHIAFNNGRTITDLENYEAGEHLCRVIHRFLLT